VSFRKYRRRVFLSAARAGNVVAAMGMYSGKLPVALGVQVFQALVRPLLEFAAEVVSITPWPGAEEIQLKMAKRILKCKQRTSDAAVMGELGWQKMEARYQQLQVSFWFKIQLMPKHAPARRIYEASMRFYSSNDAGDERVPAAAPEEGWPVVHVTGSTPGSTLWCAQLKRDLFQLGFEHCWNSPELVTELSIPQWKSKVKSAVKIREAARWWREVQSRPILRTYILLKEPKKLRREAHLNIPHGGWNDRIREGRCALTQLRCGTNDLRIHTGRFDGTEAAQRYCLQCPVDIFLAETEQHFLLECELYSDRRKSLWNSISSIVNDDETTGEDQPRIASFDASSLSSHEQLTIMTCGKHPLITGENTVRRVMSQVLIEIAEWTRMREQKFACIKRALHG
jgi:hypothetical protein